MIFYIIFCCHNLVIFFSKLERGGKRERSNSPCEGRTGGYAKDSVSGTPLACKNMANCRIMCAVARRRPFLIIAILGQVFYNEACNKIKKIKKNINFLFISFIIERTLVYRAVFQGRQKIKTKKNKIQTTKL